MARTQHGKNLTSCFACGYSDHVDICHIKDVQLFDGSATLGEINDSANVVALCKLHHWEFDNGYRFEGLNSEHKPLSSKKATELSFSA